MGLLVSNRASFESRRDGVEGQGAEVVQIEWIGVEMWEIGAMGTFAVPNRVHAFAHKV